MKVTTNKYGDVNIRWQYNLTNGDRDVTKAFLEQKVNPKEDAVIIKEVSVMRKPSEKYDKEKARFFALSRLVKESFDRKESFKDRETVWDAYKSRSTKK